MKKEKEKKRFKKRCAALKEKVKEIQTLGWANQTGSKTGQMLASAPLYMG